MAESTKGTAARYLQKLSSGSGISREMDGATREAATRDSLSVDRAREAFERAEKIVERESEEGLRPLEPVLDRVFLKDGVEAVDRLRNDGAEAELEERHIEALEAIVEADGSRPTLEFSADDMIDKGDQRLNAWGDAVEKYEGAIHKVASSVGRIDLDGVHIGTGFAIKHGLVLTNRHVLQDLAMESSPGEWRFRGEPTITFDANPEIGRTRQFNITHRVVQAGKDTISRSILDLGKLDYAVLECKIEGDHDFPDPLPLESDRYKVVSSRPIYTVGYPAKPTNPPEYEFETLHRLFSYRFGVKRFAPGEVERALSATGTEGSTVFTHDTTTLAGSSGSCVVDLGNDGLLVIGLHFAGRRGSENYAHANADLQPDLEEVGLTWKAWL